MFSNIGGKIKVLAKVLCWIGIIASIVIGLLLINGNALMSMLFRTLDVEGDLPDIAAVAVGSAGIISGVSTIIIGSLLSWVNSFVLYGFGELVANSSELVYLKTHEKRS